jgi:hypothetical protein
MKQHITVEQLKELEKIDTSFGGVSVPFYYKDACKVFTIGKMIEMLEMCDIQYTVDNGYWPVWEVKTINEKSKIKTFQDEELVDCLLEAVKFILD